MFFNYSPLDHFKTHSFSFNLGQFQNFELINDFFMNTYNLNFLSIGTLEMVIFFVILGFFGTFAYFFEGDSMELFLEQLMFSIFFISLIYIDSSVELLSRTLLLSEGVLNFADSFNFMFEISFYLLFDFLVILAIIFLVHFMSERYTSILYLYSQNVLTIIDEFIFKFVLNLYVDSLEIKTNNQSKQFQEFFIVLQSVFLFILGSNLAGAVPYSTTITASLINTFFVALILFFIIISTILLEKGFYHMLSLFYPPGCPIFLIPLLVPIEFISYIFRVISLSVRLFANMMAGHTLFQVIGEFSANLAFSGELFLLHYVPFIVLNILFFLELGVAFVQAYIFLVLVNIYMRDIFMGH